MTIDTIFSPTNPSAPTPTETIGTITKTDGTSGAILVKIAPDADPDDVFDAQFLFVLVDGHIVPMRIASVTKRGDRSATITLASIQSVSQAQSLIGCRICVPTVKDGDAPEDVEEVQPLIGYTVISTDAGEVGIIEEIDDTVAANPLFIVRRADGREVLLPATDDFVVAIDDEAQTLTLQLPGGLLDIEGADEV